jgi:hypothetical protein
MFIFLFSDSKIVGSVMGVLEVDALSTAMANKLKFEHATKPDFQSMGFLFLVASCYMEKLI